MQTKHKNIHVIGHKNPDTDSVCSAISYARLKNCLAKKYADQRCYIPCCAGPPNPETAFVLDYFHAQSPQLLQDVRSLVSDASLHPSHPVHSNLSLKNAWSILNDEHLSTLPVVDEHNHLKGLITLGDIAKSFMGIYASTLLAEAKTPYTNILETLDGHLLTGDPDAYVAAGKVLIAAANPDLMENYIEKNDIVILGDRYESQLCAIEMHASCLIICMGAEVSETILALARKEKCTIITTRQDTFITARLLNQSIPIEHFMVADDLITFHMNDPIDEIREIMSQQRHRDFPVLDMQDRYVGMLSRRSLIEMDKKQVILVDHNERAQAVDGIADAEILEIIDHHKLGHIETMSPVLFHNRPVGCTATIIYMLYQDNEIAIPPDTAGLMCAAILSDTLLYRSPTCTALDRQAGEALAEIAGIQTEAFAGEMFDAASSLNEKTAEEIFYQDYKSFTAGETTFSVGQITSMNRQTLEALSHRLAPCAREALARKEADMIFFMLTHITDESTLLLCYGNGATDTAVQAFGSTADGDTVFLPGVVSRKKQLIPPLSEQLQSAR